MGSMKLASKHRILTLFAFALIISSPCYLTSPCYATPTRTSISKGLSHPYRKPYLVSEGYSDKFIPLGAASKKAYTVRYQSDDPILIVSLTGGVIKSFIRSESGQVQLSFSSKFSNSNGPIYLKLFTESRLEFAANEVGFKTAISGAWFDSTSAAVNSRPAFSDEAVVEGSGNNIFWSYTYLGNSKKNVPDLVSAYIPNTALSYINGGSALSAEELVIRKLSLASGAELTAATSVTKDEGVLIKIPVSFSRKSATTSIDVAGH